jgi:hypothetical protein
MRPLLENLLLHFQVRFGGLANSLEDPFQDFAARFGGCCG